MQTLTHPTLVACTALATVNGNEKAAARRVRQAFELAHERDQWLPASYQFAVLDALHDLA